MSRIAVALWIAFGVATAAADDVAPSLADVRAQRTLAVESVRTLHAAARTLKKIGRELERAGKAPDYAKWLKSAEVRLDSLAGRYQSTLDYFQRDFPNEALEADPARLAYARDWIARANRELGPEAAELARKLAEANAAFASTAPAAAHADATAALTSLAELPDA